MTKKEKRSVKKLARILLAAALLCAVCGAAADRRHIVETYGDYRCYIREDDCVEIMEYLGSGASAVEIPAELGGHPVVAIEQDAFFYSSYGIVSILIPDSLTTVPANPFYNSGYLAEIKVSPEHPALEVVDGVLFGRQDQRLICYPRAFTAASYAIPQGTRIIGEDAFYNCTALTQITIPDSVTSIADSAFYCCEGLTGIEIPDSVVSIGRNAFYACESLTGVSIPDGITSIEEKAFYWCTHLTSVWIPDSVTAIGKHAFASCDRLTAVTIPDSVTTIGDYAFASCDSLADVNIPAGVTAIGKSAFDRCPVLTLTVTRGSYAEQYCKDNGLNYICPGGGF